jgi:hypothetical protein
MKHRTRTIMCIFSLLTVLFLLGACVTLKARKTQTAGFLGDYSQLKEGDKEEAQLVYTNPDADIQSYTSILMDPIGYMLQRRIT